MRINYYYNYKINRWKIEGNNLILISTQENVRNEERRTILKIGDNHI